MKRKKKEEAASRKLTTEEMDDLNEDYKNLKKRMRGIITEKELDTKMGLAWIIYMWRAKLSSIF